MILQRIPNKNIMIVTMNRSIAHTIVAALAGAAILSGCETLNPPAPAAPAPRHAGTAATPTPKPVQNPSTPAVQTPALNPEQTALRDGIELYNKGAYAEAIKRLGAPEITSGAKATQVQALKYTAFSYCVSNRATMCRMAFEKAFKLDPAFDLLPGEHGHPLWGPVFAKAKKAK
jgi:curli biogenesis system outer membrane secretion channel CsgG